MKRTTLKECRCRYQKEKPWGYALFRWLGTNRSPWQMMMSGGNLNETVKAADKVEVALITCQGCGKELLREYPTSPVPSRSAERQS